MTTYPRLVAAVALVSGSRPAAEDAVQEALLRAWERSERGEHIESLPAWVATVAVLAHPPGAERVDLERAVVALPRRQREAVVLRYYLGMDTKEVAEVLRIHEGTVKSTLFRARAALAETLDIDETEEADDRGEA